MNNACANVVKEEANAVNTFNAARDQLISNLNILLKEAAKYPVVSAYDVFGTDFVFAAYFISYSIMSSRFLY